MENKKLRIRDFFKIKDMIFSTVAYSDGNKVEGLLRYVEDIDGARKSRLNNKRYKKLGFEESYKYLEKEKPEYLINKSGKKRQIIPKKDIDKIYRPNKSIRKKPELEIQNLLVDMGIDKENIGITGSRLVGLETKSSDIDLVIYGLKNFHKSRKAIEKLIKKGELQPYTKEKWVEAYKKRNPSLTYKEFVEHEKRKKNRAIYKKQDLDLLFVRKNTEVPLKKLEGSRKQKKKIKAKVIDDKMNFDSPAIYKIKHPEIDLIASYTHTYAGQAFKGEKIIAKGIHQSGEKEVLIIGSTREAKGEYIKSTAI